MDVLQDSAALALLLSLEDRGVDITLDGSQLVVRPLSALTSDEVQAVRRHKQSLVRLVQIADPDVQDRVVSFRAQRPSTAPVFSPGWRYLKGLCFSCGARLQPSTWGRCSRCAFALRLAWGLPISASETEPMKEVVRM